MAAGSKLDWAPKFQTKLNTQVRDEKGRRRFHGAFTGGFSAGYYNSVGSKEGMC
jgi:G patch domain-containing protein 1